MVVVEALAGCAKPSVAGKWTGNLPVRDGVTIPSTIEFKADGTETGVATAFGHDVTMTGTWKIDGDTLTQTITSIKIGGRDNPMAGKSDTSKFKLEGNTLTITPTAGSAPYTLTRSPQ
jgi:hypothetical protein